MLKLRIIEGKFGSGKIQLHLLQLYGGKGSFVIKGLFPLNNGKLSFHFCFAARFGI